LFDPGQDKSRRAHLQIDNNSSGMPDVAIVGAGELGGALAHVLASRDLAGAIHLVDDAGRVAEGKALDIAQSAPLGSFTTKISGSTELPKAAGASLIFVADRVDGGEWRGEAGLLLLARIARLGRHGIVVCAGAGQRELVERGVRELQFARNRLLGSAPEALAAAVRALAAIETGASPRDVALTVLGIPPSAIVVPWEQASTAGASLATALGDLGRRRLTARLPPLWPPGPYALAMAAAKAAASLLGRSRETVSAFVAPDDSTGRRARAAALPVRLGVSGIERIAMPDLNPHDRVALDNAMLL
jgi:malate dehydrogenase